MRHPGGDGAGDTDLGSERRRPSAAWVGASSLAEEVRREASRWHGGRQQHEVNRPRRTDRAQVACCTRTTFAARPLDRQNEGGQQMGMRLLVRITTIMLAGTACAQGYVILSARSTQRVLHG